MKQKNLILIAVAVVCGLGAALLTTQMSARSTAKPPETVKVPVASKDIAIGTRFAKKDLETFFTIKDFPKDAVPPGCIQNIDDLAEKRIARQISMGNTIDQRDVNATGFIEPPPGTSLISAPISLDQAASGFAIPGTHVVVICSKRSPKKNKEFVFPLLVDTLVLAVNTNPGAPTAGSGDKADTHMTGFQQVSMISFAVSPADTDLFTMAANGGATLRLALSSQKDEERALIVAEYKKVMPSREDMLHIFSDDWDDEKKTEASKGPAIEYVKVWVPRDNLESGLQLTEDVLTTKFKELDFPKEHLPAGVVTEPKDLSDLFVTVDLAAGLMVAKGHVSKLPPKKAENSVVQNNTVAGPKSEASEADYAVALEKKYVDGEPAPKPKPEYVYVTVHTPQGKKVYQYEKTSKGNLFVKEVTPGLDDDLPPGAK